MMGNRKRMYAVRALTDYTVRIDGGTRPMLLAFAGRYLEKMGEESVRSARLENRCLLVGKSIRFRMETLIRQRNRLKSDRWYSYYENGCDLGLYFDGKRFRRYTHCTMVGMKKMGYGKWMVEFADGLKGPLSYDLAFAERLTHAINELKARGEEHTLFGLDNVYISGHVIYLFGKDDPTDEDNAYVLETDDVRCRLILCNGVADFNTGDDPEHGWPEGNYELHDSLFRQYFGSYEQLNEFIF